MKRKQLLLAATAVFFALQLIVIGSVIIAGNQTLSRGVECSFKATGYDPRDPLRGRYIHFQPIVETQNADKELLDDKNYGIEVYFQISETPGKDGYTEVLRCALKPSEEGLWFGPVKAYWEYTLSYDDKKEDEKWDDFHKRQRESPKKIKAYMRSEKFYVPENKAQEMEQNLQKNGAVAVYRVYKGRILLENLEVNK